MEREFYVTIKFEDTGFPFNGILVNIVKSTQGITGVFNWIERNCYTVGVVQSVCIAEIK